jgi:hypothetical protein
MIRFGGKRTYVPYKHPVLFLGGFALTGTNILWPLHMERPQLTKGASALTDAPFEFITLKRVGCVGNYMLKMQSTD